MPNFRTISNNSGQAVMILALFFVFISAIIVTGLSFGAIGKTRIARGAIESKTSFYLAEASAEEVAYRAMQGMSYSPTEVLVLDGYTATTIVTEGPMTGGLTISTEGDVRDKIRIAEIHLTIGSGTSFAYGIQVGVGGLDLYNNAEVTGHVYASGPVVGHGPNHLIRGDVVSSGATGIINSLNATGTIYAHTIIDSDTEKDAFADTITGSQVDFDLYADTIVSTTVGGMIYPAIPDKPDIPFPVTDAMIDDWQLDATPGLYTGLCPYDIDYDVTLGNVTIECDVEIHGNPTITIDGTIWIKGNLHIQNNPVIQLAASVGAKSVPIIVHNPADLYTSSKVTFENSPVFENSGVEGSYHFIISRNRSAEDLVPAIPETAILVDNFAEGDFLVYAPHGEIELLRNIDLKEVTGYQITLRNFTNVTYELGLQSLLFTPDIAYEIERWWENE